VGFEQQGAGPGGDLDECGQGEAGDHAARSGLAAENGQVDEDASNGSEYDGDGDLKRTGLSVKAEVGGSGGRPGAADEPADRADDLQT
jgi:hypothetical protein